MLAACSSAVDARPWARAAYFPIIWMLWDRYGTPSGMGESPAALQRWILHQVDLSSLRAAWRQLYGSSGEPCARGSYRLLGVCVAYG
jgi:hypothetical protein